MQRVSSQVTTMSSLKRRTLSLSAPQKRYIFGSLFGKGGQKQCESIEPLFRKFQDTCEDSITGIESTFEHGSLNHLLQTLYKCQRIGIRDKFFYDALLERVHSKMGQIYTAREMVLLGVAMGSQKDFQKDQPEMIKEFYEHCYKHRYLLAAEDKTALNTIFTQIGAVQLYTKHLDLFQEVKRKEVALLTCKLWNIELDPEQFRVDFDFQNSVFILQNKASGQTIVVHGSKHNDRKSIQFGNQLIDTFKPSSILVEDGPLQVVREAQRTCPETGFLIPATYDMTDELYGDVADQFIQRSIEGNEDAYVHDLNEGLILKRFEDGIEEPHDMASYAVHHIQRFRKTNSITDQVKLVFCDLSAEEIAASFVRFIDPSARHQLRQEIHYGALLETASWMAENYQQGCVKCAPFLARQMMKPYPDRPIRFVTSEQVPSYIVREKQMAYKILKQALDNPGQQNFVAYVGKDHLMAIAKQISDFLNNPKSFREYERPPQVVDVEQDTDGSVRREMIKTFALASIIYEDDLSDKHQLPFKHDPVHDINLLKTLEDDLQKDIALIPTFQEFTNIVESLSEQDKVPDDLLEQHMKEQEDPERLIDFIRSERGGGGMAKCYPLSYMQGNFAYHSLKEVDRN